MEIKDNFGDLSPPHSFIDPNLNIIPTGSFGLLNEESLKFLQLAQTAI